MSYLSTLCFIYISIYISIHYVYVYLPVYLNTHKGMVRIYKPFTSTSIIDIRNAVCTLHILVLYEIKAQETIQTRPAKTIWNRWRCRWQSHLVFTASHSSYIYSCGYYQAYEHWRRCDHILLICDFDSPSRKQLGDRELQRTSSGEEKQWHVLLQLANVKPPSHPFLSVSICKGWAC